MNLYIDVFVLTIGRRYLSLDRIRGGLVCHAMDHLQRHMKLAAEDISNYRTVSKE